MTRTILLLLIFSSLFSCTSDPDIKSMDEDEKTRISTEHLRKGKEKFDEIQSDVNHKAEDFEKVVVIWEEGLKYQPRNTIIRREIVLLHFNMAKAYVDRKVGYQAQALEKKSKGMVEEAKKFDPMIANSEKKAVRSYQRVLSHISILLSQSQAREPKEELMLLNFMVVSNIYLKRFDDAMRILNSQVESTPEDDPKMTMLLQWKDALQLAIDKMRRE